MQQNLQNKFYSANSNKAEKSKNKIKTKNTRYYSDWFFVALASITANVLALALPLVMIQTYDRIIPNASYGTLSLLLIGVIACITAEATLRYCRSHITSWAAAKYEHSKHSQVMQSMLSNQYSTQASNHTGERLHNLKAINKLKELYGGQAFVALIDLPFSFAFLYLIYVFAGNLALVPAIILSAYCLYCLASSIMLYRATKAENAISKARTNFIANSLSNAQQIKAMGAEEQLVSQYQEHYKQQSAANYKASNIAFNNANVSFLLTQAMIISVAAFGAYKIVNGQVGMGVLAACILTAGRIMAPAQKAIALLAKWPEYTLARAKLKQFTALANKPQGNALTQLLPNSQLTISSLSHGINGTKILDNINLSIKGKTTTKLVSNNHLSATYLLKILAGIVQPSIGLVQFKSKQQAYNLQQIADTCLASNICYLPSNGTIFRGSILQNLTMFGTTPVKHALAIASKMGLDNYINKLPDGYDTQLNDNINDPLTKGIKQRITISRGIAMLTKDLQPKNNSQNKYILFDNADNGLDKIGYNYLFKLLGELKGKVAIVIATEDTNLSKICDNEIRITDGVFSNNSIKENIYSPNTQQEATALTPAPQSLQQASLINCKQINKKNVAVNSLNLKDNKELSNANRTK